MFYEISNYESSNEYSCPSHIMFYLQMISSLLAPVYGIMSSGSTQKKIQSDGTSHQAQLDPMDYTIPDGNSA
jgi:hypothetical protein